MDLIGFLAFSESSYFFMVVRTWTFLLSSVSFTKEPQKIILEIKSATQQSHFAVESLCSTCPETASADHLSICLYMLVLESSEINHNTSSNRLSSLYLSMSESWVKELWPPLSCSSTEQINALTGPVQESLTPWKH